MFSPPIVSMVLVRTKKTISITVVLLAEEYIANSEHDKALSILMHVLLDYRQERWPPLLTKLLATALRAAYLAANPVHFLTLAIEYMSTCESKMCSRWRTEQVSEISSFEVSMGKIPTLPAHSQGLIALPNYEIRY